MRKLTAFDPLASGPAAAHPPSYAFSPSPSPDYYGNGLYSFPSIPFYDTAFDIATLFFISCLILLSVFGICFIFHLRFKSKSAHHLNHFNYLWSIRLLLVLFIAFWSVNEILRLPSFHRRYIYPFLPQLTLAKQSDLCKLHVVLSLGIFEPGFLITLLFLVNVSIKKRKPRNLSAIALIFATCLPVFVLQVVFVFFTPLESQLPGIFETSSVLSIDAFNNKTMMCTYPLFSTMVFAAFGFTYSVCFLFSYWRVVSLVINKGTSFRIHILALSVLVSVPMQVLFLAASSFWRPDHPAYGGVMLGMFVCVSFCAAAGEGLLVIKPLSDALSAASIEYCRWEPGVRLRSVDSLQQVAAVEDGVEL